MTDYTVAVLEDAIGVLQILSDHPDGLSLAQVTELTGLVKNKVFRILFTLEKHQMVMRDATGRYLLGQRLMALGQQIENQTLLKDASLAVMNRLVVQTGESIFLGVVSGMDALCIAARESPRSIRLFAQVGRRAPLHSGGVPKVLLAYMPEDQQRAVLDKLFATQTIIPGTNTDRAMLESKLAQIREQGYAIVSDELDMDAHSIAAPIFNHQGQVIAAISIAGPSNRFSEQTISRYVELVLEASEQISQALGYESDYSWTGEIIMPGLF